jgi:hypothetical protein
MEKNLAHPASHITSSEAVPRKLNILDRLSKSDLSADESVSLWVRVINHYFVIAIASIGFAVVVGFMLFGGDASQERAWNIFLMIVAGAIGVVLGRNVNS